MRNRLKARPNAAVIRYVTAPGIERDLAYVWPYMVQAHMAHALMLKATGIAPTDVADALIGGIARLAENGPASLDADPEIEDVYFNVEAHLGRQLGSDTAGWLQTGRSRNDHIACVARLWVRHGLVTAVLEICKLRRELVSLATRHSDTVMTGYTHQQPGQPITLGHYLLGVEAGLARDTDRLRNAWPRVNLSPLGTGSMAGVSWPIDRELLAELLGFEGIAYNSVDAVASRDFALETVSAFVSVTLTLSRLAADLQQFATWEFGGIEVADDVAAVSSIMPQKKNPVTLEHCKGAAAQVVGAWSAMAFAIKSTPYSHQRETSVESMRPYPEALSQTRKAVALMRSTLEGLIVKTDVLKAGAAENFSVATDLADMITREAGVNFREAHGIVGAAVRGVLTGELGDGRLSAEVLQHAAKEVAGKDIGLSLERVAVALDPENSVRSRSVIGGPAPASMQKMLEQASSSLVDDESWAQFKEAIVNGVASNLLRPNQTVEVEGGYEQ